VSISITKRRLVSLASTAGVIATMAVAAMPTATLAAADNTVVVRGTSLTAKYVNPTEPVTGNINATGFDIAVYYGPGHTGKVDANIYGATWYGVVADRANVTVTGSQIHAIGDNPLNGVQRGNPIYFYNGARGTISNNSIYDFQKNGITVSGKAVDGSSLSEVKTSATVQNNTVIGEGPIDYIAQNGIQVSFGASAVVKGNTVRGFDYTPVSTEATGLLSYEAALVAVSGNTFSRNEVDIYGPVKTIRDVRGSFATTVRPHHVRIDFRSVALPKDSVTGDKLHWVVRIDGKTRLDMRQGFGEHDVFSRHVNPGKHRVVVYKNGVVVKNAVIKF
jgi:nitrous oxidase accessory protein NosD